MVAYFCNDKVAYFCLWQHFHDDGKKEENDGSIEVESAKEVNFLLKERKNLEGDYDQDTGERTSCSLDKEFYSGSIIFVVGSLDVVIPCRVPLLLLGRVLRS